MREYFIDSFQENYTYKTLYKSNIINIFDYLLTKFVPNYNNFNFDTKTH